MSRFTYFLHILFLLVILIGGVAVWCHGRQVPPAEPASFTNAAPLAPFESRQINHITLHAGRRGDIGFALSLPDPMPAGEKLPVLVVLGALDSGENNIRHIHNAGNNAIIGYDWPLPPALPKDGALLLQSPWLYGRVMNMPGQVASIVKWLQAQPWADDKRISLLGFSLGALATPAAQDLIQQDQMMVHSTIIAYGGAPLGAVFAADTYIQPGWMRLALAPMIGFFLHPLEPEAHLQTLEGSFLILEGKSDNLIPEPLRARLRDAVPEPKKIIDFEGDHMGEGPAQDQLLDEIINSSRNWLLQEEAVNPL